MKVRVIGCRNAGVDCDIVRGETERKFFRKGEEHGRQEHKMTDISWELAQKMAKHSRDV